MIARYVCLFFVILTVSCKKIDRLPENISFINPLLSSGPDPWIVQKDSFYYYTNTLSDRIELRRTKSVSRVSESLAKVVWTPPATGTNRFHIWAPELHFLDNKWYIYYTAGPTSATSHQRMFVLENSFINPMEGTWVDKGQLKDPTADYFALDATVFDYNNKRYAFWSSTEPNNDDQNIYF